MSGMRPRPSGVIVDGYLIIDGRKRSAQTITCGYCPASDTLSGTHLVSPEFASRRFRQRGWDVPRKGKPTCPDCLKKFRAQAAAKRHRKEAAAEPAPTAEVVRLDGASRKPDQESTMPKPDNVMPLPARDIDRAARQRVLRAIIDNWDADRGRYVGAVTDHALSEQLKVPLAWVEDMRRENFGDTGGNDELEALRTELGALEATIETHVTEGMALAQRFDEVLRQVKALGTRVGRAEQSVGIGK